MLLPAVLVLFLASFVYAAVVVECFVVSHRRNYERSLVIGKGTYIDDDAIASYDALGFSPQLRINGFSVPTHVIFGTNAMESAAETDGIHS